jgi:hypothetical protein
MGSGKIRAKFGDIWCREMGQLENNLAGFVLFLGEKWAEWAVDSE